MLQRLIRSKALDAARLQGCLVAALDATGHLTFAERHCEHCLEYRHAAGAATYHHQVLEAKLLGLADMALSLATEFIENADDDATLAAEARKQARLRTQSPVAFAAELAPGVSATAFVLVGRCPLRVRPQLLIGQGP
jgi:streptomycin 6-kinase